jgi:hypothetical protein
MKRGAINLQKLFKTSLENSSGCIISWADIWPLSHESKYGGLEEWYGLYAALSNAPRGTAGTLSACAGSAY